ncbi:MAG: hypothetical protein J6X52_06180 [Clostridia bacterium]|nr:hypothetical protein [Clostridia bacterium]
MKLRTICILLALIMAVSLVVVSCGGNNGDTSKEPASADISGQSDNSADNSEVISSEESQALVPHLDDTGLNLNGKVFKILAMDNHQLYQVEQICGYYRPEGNEEIEDDPVKTAIQNRNNKILDEYGVTIEVEACEGYDAFVTRVKNDFLDPDVDYQAFCGGSNFLAPLTIEGYTLDFYGMGDKSYLALDEEWWDPVTQGQMSIGGHLFMINGDLLLTDDEQTKCMFFNKDIVENHLGQSVAFEKHPYQLVRDGEWTVDKMYEMMKEAAVDGDNGRMDYDGADTWGLVGVSFDTYMLVMGSGLAQVKKDSEDLPVFAMRDEANKNAFFKVYEMVGDKDRTLFVEDYFRWDDAEGKVVTQQFYNGKALFMTGSIQNISGDALRNAEIHYGILPMPKYNDAQENYSSTVNPYHFGILCIPAWVTEDELPEITFTLEAMAYLGNRDVTREYYDRTLKLKRFQDDDDSSEILDIVFRNRLVDISVIFNWADCIQYYNQLRSSGSDNVESFLQGKEGAFNAAMEQTIQNFMDLDQ